MHFSSPVLGSSTAAVQVSFTISSPTDYLHRHLNVTSASSAAASSAVETKLSQNDGSTFVNTWKTALTTAGTPTGLVNKVQSAKLENVDVMTSSTSYSSTFSSDSYFSSSVVIISISIIIPLFVLLSPIKKKSKR
jgi:hypothetical protein